jgi:hypothetical protein
VTDGHWIPTRDVLHHRANRRRDRLILLPEFFNLGSSVPLDGDKTPWIR